MGVQEFLVLGFGFGEPNGQLVQILLAFFDRLAGGVFFAGARLRFKANFQFAPFGSKLEQVERPLEKARSLVV